MLDQGGIFLHELLHVMSLAGVRINDGVNKCYSWYNDCLPNPLPLPWYPTHLSYRECITKAAKPDNGGEDRPWNIAKSYEVYAYTARALGTRECNVDEAKVTAPYIGAQRAMPVTLFFLLRSTFRSDNAIVPISTTSASRGSNLASLTILPLLVAQPDNPHFTSQNRRCHNSLSR